MKKQKNGLTVALLCVLAVIAILLALNLAKGGIFVLEGLNGKDGKDGADGAAGTNGQNGKNAYELALEDGFEGSLHEWLLSLAVRGEEGRDGVNGVDGTNGIDGTGVRDVRIDENGRLLVTLTDGSVLDAGYVGTENGSFDPVPDADGFYEVYEQVVMHDRLGESLKLRAKPEISDSSEVLFVITAGTELLRVGDQQTADGFSRFIYRDQICYARSKYFDLKYQYEGTVPEIRLPDRMALTVGEQAWFYTDQILPRLADDLRVSYSYSGSGQRVYNGGQSFAVTPAWRSESGEAVHAPESATLTVRVETTADGTAQTVVEKKVAITVVARQDALAVRGLFIGDSRISDNTILTELASHMPALELIGTRETLHSGLMHEGRSSWSTEEFLHNAYKDITATQRVQNAFYNPTTGAFDFTYYMEQTQFAAPDFVVINLGANDNFSRQSAENIATMVASIRAYAAARGITIQIAVLTEYLSPSNGYYLDQSYNADVAAKRSRQAAYFGYLSEQLAGREHEGVYLLSTHQAINDWGDWTRKTVTVDNGVKEERITDVVHLGTDGYRKEEALIRAWLYATFGA